MKLRDHQKAMRAAHDRLRETERYFKTELDDLQEIIDKYAAELDKEDERIAAAVQAEREECARLVKFGAVQVSGRQYVNYLDAWRDLRDALAAAIRARAQEKQS